MKLSLLDFSEIYFPTQEWKWFRASTAFDAAQPELFAWGVRVGEKVWTWSLTGGAYTSEVDSLKIPVLLLDSDGSELQAHALYLKTAFAFTKAQEVEWVAALQVLEERLHYSPAERGLPMYWKQTLESCGLSGHLGALAQRQKYTFLNADEQKFLFDNRWDVATFELLETLSTAVRSAFLNGIEKWKLSAQQTKEALNYTQILARKISESAALNVLSGNFQNAEEFRLALIRTSQPEMAMLNQKRVDMLRDLRVPPRCSVFGDPTFEKDILRITHTPRTTGDFEIFKSWVNDPSLATKIKALLEIYN